MENFIVETPGYVAVSGYTCSSSGNNVQFSITPVSDVFSGVYGNYIPTEEEETSLVGLNTRQRELAITKILDQKTISNSKNEVVLESRPDTPVHLDMSVSQFRDYMLSRNKNHNHQ